MTLVDKIAAGRPKDIPDIAKILKKLSFTNLNGLLEIAEKSGELYESGILLEAYSRAFGEEALSEYMRENPGLDRGFAMVMSWIKYYEKAAVKAEYDTFLWIRYLNKSIQRDQIWLTKEDINSLLNSNKLLSYQRVFLKLAVEPGTTAWEITVSLSEPAKRFPHLERVKQKLANDKVKRF